jgi:hypothetical protein
MAFVKAVNPSRNRPQTLKGMKMSIRYISNPDKASEVSGLNVSDNPMAAYDEMRSTKAIYNKTGEERQYTDGRNVRQWIHYDMSFDPHDNITPEKAHEIAREWAEKEFPDYEVLIATHTDRDYIHNHFIVNSVSFKNGHKYNQPARFLDRIKKDCDRICEREGLAMIKDNKPRQKGDVRAYSKEKYQLLKRVTEGEKDSYLVNTSRAYLKAAEASGSREDFKRAMQRQGYKTDWTDAHKHITFEDKDGHKVRLANLEKSFNSDIFSKERLSKMLEKQGSTPIQTSAKDKKAAEMTPNEEARARAAEMNGGNVKPEELQRRQDRFMRDIEQKRTSQDRQEQAEAVRKQREQEKATKETKGAEQHKDNEAADRRQYERDHDDKNMNGKEDQHKDELSRADERADDRSTGADRNEQSLDSTREDARAERNGPDAAGERATERTPDGIQNSIRDIEAGAGKYAPEHQEQPEQADRDHEQPEREQRDTDRADRADNKENDREPDYELER